MPSEKNFKQKLSSVFRKVAFTLALTLGLSRDSIPPAPRPASVEPLTADEITFVQGIFGNEINTSIVRKNFYPYPASYYFPDDATERIADVNDTKNIKFYGKGYQSSDYSCDAVRINYGTFIHEMTHIWQRQKIPGLKLLFMSCHDYDYTLDSASRFDDFCIEQQGAIIEDYALRFLHPSHLSYRISNTPENDLLLKKVVEDRFPEARHTRLEAEKQNQPKTAPIKTKAPKFK